MNRFGSGCAGRGCHRRLDRLKLLGLDPCQTGDAQADRFELDHLGLHLAHLLRHRIEVFLHEAVALLEFVLGDHVHQVADERPALTCRLQEDQVVDGTGQGQQQRERAQQQNRQLPPFQVQAPTSGRSPVRDQNIHDATLLA